MLTISTLLGIAGNYLINEHNSTMNEKYDKLISQEEWHKTKFSKTFKKRFKAKWQQFCRESRRKLTHLGLQVDLYCQADIPFVWQTVFYGGIYGLHRFCRDAWESNPGQLSFRNLRVDLYCNYDNTIVNGRYISMDEEDMFDVHIEYDPSLNNQSPWKFILII